MSSFEIGQVDLVALAACDALQRDQIGKRADWGLHPIYAPSLRASQEIRETYSCHLLGKQIEIAVWRSQMDCPVANETVFRDRRTVGTRRPPVLNQSADALHIGGIGIENGIDIPGCPHHSVANQRDPPDQDVADTGAVEVVQNSAEARH